jgi:5-methyltetrahydrofolate--homocysteine methyltransferase
LLQPLRRRVRRARRSTRTNKPAWQRLARPQAGDRIARIHGLYTRKWGLPEEDILFDPLTFTIATGNDEDRRLGLETLDGIAAHRRAVPEVRASSSGLEHQLSASSPSARAVSEQRVPPRAHAHGAHRGDRARSKILPQNRIPREQWEAAEWLIFDRRGASRPEGMPEAFDPLLHFIGLFPDGAERRRRASACSPTCRWRRRSQRHIIDGEDKDLERDARPGAGSRTRRSRSSTTTCSAA